MEYNLTTRDKNYLHKIGYLEEDLKWVEETANTCIYEYIGKYKEYPIDRERAIKLFGKRDWLSGIARACFHMTSAQPTKYANAHGDPYVYFENPNWGK